MLRTSARRRWTSMAAATAFGIAVLAAQPAAQGAVETCQGVPATIVGSPGTERLVGTEGADVIVSSGSAQVAGLGGDDIICITSATGTKELVVVFAGAGNDQVANLRDGSTTQTRVGLGPGDDTYTGSNGEDFVRELGNEDVEGAGTDHIRTGVGNDSVTTGQFGQPNTDTVDLGDGDDDLVVRSNDNRAATLDGGNGSDQLSKAYTYPRPVGSWRFDNNVQTATLDEVPMIVWSSFERFDLNNFANEQRLSFLGSPAQETVYFSSWFIDVAMGGGTDTVIGRQVPVVFNSLHRSHLAGGSGRDEFQFISASFGVRATGDLGRGRLFIDDESTLNDIRADLNGVEDLTFEARKITLKGDNRANRLQVTGCDVTAVGRGRNDRIVRTGADRFAGQSCLKRMKASRLAGGPGNDRITGNSLADTLIGGPGRDRAEGRKGRDTCHAEVERSCEKN